MITETMKFQKIWNVNNPDGAMVSFMDTDADDELYNFALDITTEAWEEMGSPLILVISIKNAVNVS